MPFKNRSQRKACYAKHDKNWDCNKWSKETPNKKSLPKRVKKNK